MGHKINPTSIRLNITQPWKSRWFAKPQNFAKLFQEDTKIREYVEKHLKKAGLVRLDIERTGDGTITVIIKTTKPGLIIGKGGAGIEELKKKIRQKLGIKKELKVNIEEIREINLQAQVIANSIAEQIEKRVAFRKLMKQSLEQMMNAGARGAKVAIGGRLNGAEIARTEHLALGKIPLHTLRADIDFARSTAFTTYGTVGVKVWIYKGDIFEDKNSANKEKRIENSTNR